MPSTASAEAFRDGYRALRARTRERLDAAIVICEPFVLPVPADREAWRADLDPKIAAARALAREFKGVYGPFDGVFAAASTTVDPADAGHALMAEEWIRRVCGE
ncbi:MAG: hypothetical protein NTU62_10560 [Spirochaetes bacterium]|nr:hypothetical protein [Spirochaetota bacterium]